MALGSLAFHLQTQHGKESGMRRHWETTYSGGEPYIYRMAFPTARVPRNLPVKGCLVRAETRATMRVHFFHRHVRDIIIILEEVNLPHPTTGRNE